MSKDIKSKFQELRVLDVSKYIEKKGQFNYLAWAHAVDILLQHDPMATWQYHEPQVFNDSMMVTCTVNAFGKSMTMQLPVMNYKNQAVKNPDAMQVNTAMQRCLAKAIALHGIGLYIFQGEDLADLDPLDLIKNVYATQGIEGARAVYNKMDNEARQKCQPFLEEIRNNNKESNNGTEK
jgi:chorismate mutase